MKTFFVVKNLFISLKRLKNNFEKSIDFCMDENRIKIISIVYKFEI